MAPKATHKMTKLRRTQLDRFFTEHSSTLQVRLPKNGWVRELRQALGMTLQDLGQRLGVIKQRVERIEKDELTGKVTLQTMQQAAESLNCDFVYFLVPREGLQKSLETQARKAAKEIVRSTEYTMQLEEQGTSGLSQAQLLETLTQELLLKQDRRIWKTKNENSKSSRSHTPRR